MPTANNVVGEAWHTRDATEVCKEFGTDPDKGLSAADVEQKRRQYGDNKLPEPKRASYFKMFLGQLLDFMVLILIAAAGLSAAFGDFKSSIVLGIVVVVNITIGFSQEAKAERALSSLLNSRVEAQETSVTRDGHVKDIKAPELVVGDLVNLEEGEQVPADLRLLKISHLQIDESTLTGESAPVDKSIDTLKDTNSALADRTNMAYMMTMVARGRGQGIVVRTGVHTEVGKSSKVLEENTKDKKTNLQKKLTVLGRWLVALSIVLCGIVTGLGLLRGHSAMDMIKTGVSLAVSVIPEGLVAVTTVTMALGVQRMAKKRAIVRQLPAVEVLGAVSVICTDKTGTLTEGKMKVEEVWVDGKTYYFSGTGLAPDGDLCSDAEAKKKVDTPLPSKLERLLLVCSLCNNASVYKDADNGSTAARGPRRESANEKKDVNGEKNEEVVPEDSSEHPLLQKYTSKVTFHEMPEIKGDNIRANSNQKRRGSVKRRKSVSYEIGEWKTSGTPTEISLQIAAMKVGMGKEALLQQGWKFVQDIPFDSERKRMSVVYKSPSGTTIAFSKGAAEQLLPQCARILHDDENETQMSQADKDKIMEQVMRMSGTGMRVLALASHKWEISGEEKTIENDLCFLGLVGILDPPRTEVGPSIEALHDAGITVIMITGDNPITAKAIAQKLAVITDEQEDLYVKTGPEVDEMDDKTLASLDPFPLVFARVSPEAKLRIVHALQARKNIVAFIGDGVNDAASIKNADIGVAMGVTGTDVSQQSADIILSDDNFSHITTAVEEGRRTYDNIFKFTVYLLSCNSAEIFIMLIATAFNFPIPFTSIQILFANIIADVPPSLSLGIEPVEQDTMEKQPRDPSKAFFGWIPAVVVTLQGLSMSIICAIAFVIALYAENYNIDHARCLVFTMLVLIQLFHAFLSRSFTGSVFTTGLLGNRWLIAAFLFSTGWLIAATYIPGLNTTLDMLPLTWVDWGKIGAAVVLHSFIVEIIKIFLRHRSRR